MPIDPTKAEKTIPQPVQNAREALAALRLENPALAETVKNILPALSMHLDKQGEDTTPALLLDHARLGIDHLKSLQQSKQRILVYEDIAKRQRAEFMTELMQEPKQRMWEFGRTGDVDGFKQFAQQHPKLASNNEMLQVTARLAIENGQIPFARFMDNTYGSWSRNCLRDACSHNQLAAVKYIDEELGIDPLQHQGEHLRTACRYGALPIVKYLIDDCKIDPLTYNYLSPKTFAAEGGHLDVIKYLVEHCKDKDRVRSSDTEALCKAAEKGHLDVVRYLVEECGVDMYTSHVMYGAVREKQTGVIRYLVEEQKFDLSVDKGEFHYAAARFNNLEAVKYFVEECGLRFKDSNLQEKTSIQEEVMAHGHTAMAHYLIAHCGLSKENLHPNNKKKYEGYAKWCKKWQKAIHTDPPPDCENKSPFFFQAGTYALAKKILTAENYGDGPARTMAYHAQALFGTEQRLLQYLDKWGRGRQPLHDIVQEIVIPKKDVGDLTSWGDAAIKCGPAMAGLVKYCDRLKTPEKSADGKTWSMLRTREKVSQFAYKNAAQNPALAILCLEHLVDEPEFDKALKLLRQAPAQKNLPEITIDGARFGMEGAVFYRLPANDVRAPFMGELTDCCQKVGGHGHDCAVHSVESPDGGVYVVESKGRVLGQAWAWRGRKGEMCLDTLETLGDCVKEDQWRQLMTELARELTTRKEHDVTMLTIGIGGDTPASLQQSFSTVAGADAPRPRGSYDAKRRYRESHSQLVVWKK